MLINAGALYNLLYYSYKNKYNQKINSLDTKNRTKFDYKKLRLIKIIKKLVMNINLKKRRKNNDWFKCI